LTAFAAQEIQSSKYQTLVTPAIGPSLLIVTALPFIFFVTFSESPKIFDDEGTLMITFREILDGRILYHDISALYGPFYYCTIAPLFSLLDVPLSHDAVRLVSAIFWFCCSMTFATLVWRLTGSTIAASFAGLTALFFLKFFVHSPLHPQELSFLLIGILLHLLVSMENGPKPIALALMGVIVGGLLLIKINLAMFVILPLVLGALRATSDRGHVCAFHGVVLALSLVLPMALMAPLFRLEWVIWYCVFASGTILAALVVWSSSCIPNVFTIKHWGYCISGFTATVLSTLCATIAYGTTPFEIFRATVLQNFGLVQNWYLAPPVSGGAIAITVTSLAYATLLALSRTRAMNREATMGRVIRLKAGIGILGSLAIAIAAVFGTPWGRITESMFQCLVPFAWLIMVTDETVEQNHTLARGILGLIAAFLVLYAFPVHGTQTMLATLLPAVMLPVLLNDTVMHPGIRSFLKRHWPAPPFKIQVWHRAPLTAVAYALMLAMLGSQTLSKFRDYQSLEPLNLRGASLVRIDHDSAQLLRWVVGKLVECPTFYSLPSLPSFYFWTNQKAPTGMISNNTFGVLSSEQQRLAVADLERHNDLCILMFPALLEYFDRGQLSASPPLLQYVEKNFTEVESIGPFRVLRRIRMN
jgi:hypothetical protein